MAESEGAAPAAATAATTTPAPAAAEAPKAVLAPPAASWRDSLPEDIRANEALARYETVEALAKDHVNAQSLIGKKGVIPPGEGATDEDWSRFYDSLGRPETPDKYEIKPPEGKADQWDEEGAKAWAEAAHAAGLTPRQEAAVRQWALENMGIGGAPDVDLQSSYDAAVTALKAEWGGKYDENFEYANRGFLRLSADTRKTMLRSGLVNNPEIIKLMADRGKLHSGEAKAHAGEGGAGPNTREGAMKEINTLRSEGGREGPYYNKEHPRHREVVDRVDQLWPVAYGVSE